MTRAHVAWLGLALSLGCEPAAMSGLDAGHDAGARDGGALDAGRDAGPPPPRTQLCVPDAPPPGPYPAPGAFPPNHGPGGPARAFDEAELGVNCAFLDPGEMDVTDHHNLVQMIDGYLLMPWAPEFGRGGLTFFDVSDPCAPRVVGGGYSTTMRETHAIGFSTFGATEGARYAAVNQLGRALAPGRAGIQFWDITDPTAPAAIADLELEGVIYPDAYRRITLSLFWQVPWVYVAGADNGIYIVDARDPERPVALGRHSFEPVLRAGQVQAVGNLLVVTAAEGARTVLLDISDPTDPQPIPGGDFQATDGSGEPRDAYFTTLSGGYVWYARKEGGGGVMVWDVREPTEPRYVGDYRSDGNGGYVFLHEGHAFVGESNFAAIYDVRDPSRITEVRRLSLTGDLDTAVPIGNVVVLSVDDEADPDRGSAVTPWQREPDSTPPAVTWVWPADGASMLAPTSRVGITFGEHVDPGSAWEGSVRLYRADAPSPDEGRVAGIVSTQETIVTFTPRCPLAPDTEYVLEVPAGGVHDTSGNAIATPFRSSFRTSP